MATRMQQRRGTAAQWTQNNPVLGPGEIGFESDTNKFKMGDGVNQWANLSYFVDVDALDLGGSLDDYVPLTAVGDSVASLVNGTVPSSQLDLAAYATEDYVDGAIALIPAPDYTGLATETYVNTAVSDLVASAPAALDTLNELAAALNDDANFAGTVTTALAGKADEEHTHVMADITDYVEPDLLPSQTGNSGKFLTTNGTAASWSLVSVPSVEDNYIMSLMGAI